MPLTGRIAGKGAIALPDSELKQGTIRCVTDIMDYFSHDPDISRFWPGIALTLQSLCVDLKKMQRDPSYQSRDFPTLNDKSD